MNHHRDPKGTGSHYKISDAKTKDERIGHLDKIQMENSEDKRRRNKRKDISEAAKTLHYDSAEDYRLLTQELQADIRDMEGGAVVQAAYAAQLPVYSIKAISDVAGSGSTTEQYLANKDKALANLKALLPTIFEHL